jgi:hypothetical protein
VGDVEILVDIPEIQFDNCENQPTPGDRYGNDLWTRSSERSYAKSLLIIATPYRIGCHVATRPTDFLPIIDHLIKLHEQNFVHGDIRGYNMVFHRPFVVHEGTNTSQDTDSEIPAGWLIDFDCGGYDGSVEYPSEYTKCLEDGDRHAAGRDDGKIFKWHDWYALGTLMFHFHRFVRPKGVCLEVMMGCGIYDIEGFWSHLEKHPSPDDINRLKNFLCEAELLGWTLKCRYARKNI